MIELGAHFTPSRAINISLQIHALALAMFHRVAEITGAENICIAGGFLRGLYMQQFLGLAPKMNDVDIFADMSIEEFNAVRHKLEYEFGTHSRILVGNFESEEHPCGLIEFLLPENRREQCAGAQSIQLNFGFSHPWAIPYEYIQQANIGMNQIAMRQDGTVIASQAFLDDMTDKTMTMNTNRTWLLADWIRTNKKMETMKNDRPEFKGWAIIQTPKPIVPITGSF